MIFIKDSRAKMLVKIRSVYCKNMVRVPLGSFRGLSIAKRTLEIVIKKIMAPSKMLLVVNLTKESLNLLSEPKI